MALPWPPGSKSEPSCSQGSQGTSPSELLLFMPDLTPSQSSFVLLGVGADLTHSWGPGSSVRASTPQGPACHTVTALLRDQDKVLLLAPVFPVGYVQASFVITLGNMMLPLGPERGFQRGARGLVLLSLAVIPLLDSAFTPPAAPHRLTLELDLIFLARPVILSSGHSTFQSILGTTTAQLGQLHPCGGPDPRTFCLTKPFGTVVVFLFFQFILSPNCSNVSLLFWAFLLPFFFPSNPALVLASVGKGTVCRREVVCVTSRAIFYSHFLFWPVLLFMPLWPRYFGGQLTSWPSVSLKETRYKVNTKENIGMSLELQRRPSPAANLSGQAKGPDSCNDCVNILYSK